MQTNKTPSLEQKQYLLDVVNPEINSLDASILSIKNSQLNILLVVVTLLGMIIVTGITFKLSLEMVYLILLFFVFIWVTYYMRWAMSLVIRIRKIKKEDMEEIREKKITGLIHMLTTPKTMFIISCILTLSFYPLIQLYNLSIIAYVLLLILMIISSILMIIASKHIVKDQNKKIFELVQPLYQPKSPRLLLIVKIVFVSLFIVSFICLIILLLGLAPLLYSSVRILILIIFMELVIICLSVKYYGWKTELSNLGNKKKQLNEIKEKIVFQNLSFDEIISSYREITKKFV